MIKTKEIQVIRSKRKTFSIQITDANACDTIQNNIDITEPTFISASSTTIDVLCYNGSNGSINER
jgi:hypothetical protein